MKNKILISIFCSLIILQVFAQHKKPNIIWITTEDMSYHIGAFGCKEVKTPNLDQLTLEGVKYTNCFSTAGVCAPSRAALISGKYQTSFGAHNMRTNMNSKEYEQKTGLPSYGVVLPVGLKPYPLILRENGYYTTNNSKEDYQFATPEAMWDESSKNATWRNRKDKNQPFFSIINFITTHESQVFMRDKEPLLVDPKHVEIPSYLPDNEIVRKDFARFMTNVQLMDAQVGEIIKQLKEDGLYDETYIFFYPDHGDGLPFCKREILHRGLKVPLIVKFPKSENAGTTDNQLVSFVDMAPTLFSLANIPIPKFVEGQAFIGNQKPKTERKYIYAARDRMDAEYDRVRALSDGKFEYLKNYQPEKPYYQDITYRLQQKSMLEILRLRDAGKLNEHQMQWFRPTKPIEELYDTENDPNQFVNLAENPAYKDKLFELRNKHELWIKKYGDMGAIPEKEMLTKMWNGQNTPPSTENPKVSLKKNKISISCPTPGALIAYRSKGQNTWLPYIGKIDLNNGEQIEIIARRIGYKPSEIIIARN
ncbi:sulfatase [Lacihabitans sp. LS3-19]|uniref:sulfatase family protein n=1 Tax=Lacihabitans sp. LS3-19 TaxID=2487335 RepID=UPI0020CF5B85|nr:sulfatase [Lacihabitans sp. LS3-19]MCP9768338.1 sulfatase [Lacihabitans sp. LS3-19]